MTARLERGQHSDEPLVRGHPLKYFRLAGGNQESGPHVFAAAHEANPAKRTGCVELLRPAVDIQSDVTAAADTKLALESRAKLNSRSNEANGINAGVL
jgi:hypothetical protein